jgi:hypothetical protein
MLLYGDFNFPNTSYEDLDIGGGVATFARVDNERPGDVRFQKCLTDNQLTQLVTFNAYRHSRDEEPSSLLDLIITDDPDRHISVEEDEPLGDTPKGQAHCLLKGSLAASGHEILEDPAKPRPIWNKAN